MNIDDAIYQLSEALESAIGRAKDNGVDDDTIVRELRHAIESVSDA